MELNAQIKKYRTELKLSQEELTEKVYVTRQTISNWENGLGFPDINTIENLADALDVSIVELMKSERIMENVCS